MGVFPNVNGNRPKGKAGRGAAMENVFTYR